MRSVDSFAWTFAEPSLDGIESKGKNDQNDQTQTRKTENEQKHFKQKTTTDNLISQPNTQIDRQNNSVIAQQQQQTCNASKIQREKKL